jgi:hypothetical protein
MNHLYYHYLIVDEIEDEDIKWMIDIIRENPHKNTHDIQVENTLLDQYPSLMIIGDKLYRQILDHINDVIQQFVVPKMAVEVVLQQCHNAITSGHLGFMKTKNRVKSRFYWPFMVKDMENFVKFCAKW